MTTHPAPVLTPAEQLARLFHHAYERIAPVYGYAQGRTWDHLPADYRQMLTAVMADLNLALRPGRQGSEPHAGDTVVFLLTDPACSPDRLEHARQALAAVLPDHTVHIAIAAGITQTATLPGEPK